VRLQKQFLPFAKGYHPKWTEETFSVDNVDTKKYPMFSLRDKKGDPIIGKSYKQELQTVLEDSNTHFRIDKILGTRGRGKDKEYFVSWLGYPDSFNSYVKASEISHK